MSIHEIKWKYILKLKNSIKHVIIAVAAALKQ